MFLTPMLLRGMGVGVC